MKGLASVRLCWILGVCVGALVSCGSGGTGGTGTGSTGTGSTGTGSTGTGSTGTGSTGTGTGTVSGTGTGGEGFVWAAAAFAQGIEWGVSAAGDRVAARLSNPRTDEVWTTVWRSSSVFAALGGSSGGSVSDVVVGDGGIATLSTTHVALLRAWDDELAHWAGGAYVDYLMDSVAIAVLDDERAADFSGSPEIDKEQLLMAAPGALTIYPFGDPLSGTGIAEAIPVVPIGEYLEPHPLGRAEWMVLFGWMCGKEQEAEAAFAACAERYLALTKLPVEVRRPRVFAGSVRNGTWHAPGGESLVAALLQDAGAEYIFKGTNGHENVEVPLEEMFALAADADAWGVVWHAPEGLTMETLLTADERHAWLVPEGVRVFGANTASCDYFGSWVAAPDALLENLINLFHPELLSERPGEGCFEWLTETGTGTGTGGELSLAGTGGGR